LKFLCDADVDRPLVDRLRDEGHDVLYMAEIKKDSADEEVLKVANENGAVLITRDKGFGELVFRQGLSTHGVLLLRLAGLPMGERSALLARAVHEHSAKFRGAFSVLTRSGLRIRPGFPPGSPP
jgi:predicted nuclease of predicted toxin-antitoxin system